MVEVFLLDVRLGVALKSFQMYLCKQNLQTVLTLRQKIAAKK